jgi:hypothetical protein
MPCSGEGRTGWQRRIEILGRPVKSCEQLGEIGRGDRRRPGRDAHQRRHDPVIGVERRGDGHRSCLGAEEQLARPVRLRVGHRRRDRGVTAERHLGERAEIPYGKASILARRGERGLREAHLRRGVLHRRIVQTGGVENHAGRIPTRPIVTERYITLNIHDPTIG